jgi:hypothetical protein
MILAETFASVGHTILGPPSYSLRHSTALGQFQLSKHK